MPFLAHLARCCTAWVWSDQNTVKLQAIAKELFSIKIPLIPRLPRIARFTQTAELASPGSFERSTDLLRALILAGTACVSGGLSRGGTKRRTVESRQANMTPVAQSGYWTIDKVYEMFLRLKSGAIISATSFSRRAADAGDQRTLTLNPQVLLLDEPTEGLAPTIIDELLKAFGTITRSGGICSIIVEQHAQKILEPADRVVILERGAIVHAAASAEARADPAVLDRYLGVPGKS
jgi:hypothetical protein